MKTLRALGEALINMAGSRFELFSMEFRLERARIAVVVMLVVIGGGSLLLAGVAFTAGLVWAVPPGYRLLALGSCMGLYLIVAIGCLLAVVRFFRRAELPFSETRKELNKDVECLISAIKNKK